MRKTRTPNKNEIEARARELYVQDAYRNGAPQLADLNPSTEELVESGFMTVAASELMTS
jgi:hypothetical protein